MPISRSVTLFLTAALGGLGCSEKVPDIGDTAGYGEIDFTASHMIAQGYWYSRYNLNDYLMKSDAGETFVLEDELPGITDYMVAASDGIDNASWYPTEWNLLRVPSTTGDPHYAGPADGDGATWTDNAWVSHGSDPSLETLGWTAMKESMWARQFHVDDHFGVPGDDSIPGAAQRFFGGALIVQELVQLAYYSANPGEHGDDLGGYYVLLAAAADMAEIAVGEPLPHSDSNRFADFLEQAAPMIPELGGDSAADWTAALTHQIYADAVAAGTPTTVREMSLAIYGLSFYGMFDDGALADALRAQVVSYGDGLAAADLADVYEMGMAIRGLIQAWRITGDSAYEDAANSALDALLADYDADLNYFTSTTTYDVEAMAGLMSGLNAASLFLGNGNTDAVFVPAFENLINISGFQMSTPGLSGIASFEQLPNPDDPDELYHRYPPQPFPRDGDGADGIAPVYAGSVTIDSSGAWTGIDRDFNAAGAFHLANEMIWFHNDEVDGFPTF